MLRTLQVDDLPRILDFRHAMMAENGAAGRFHAEWRERTAQIYADLYQGGRGVHFGWLAEGQIVGTAGAMIRTDFPFNTLQSGCYGWIMDVYVLPGWRGQGIARRLTQATLDWLSEREVRVIKLVASDQALALGLYERLGFRRTNEMVFSPAPNRGA